MTGPCNFHTHTTYCDGRSTPEEMVVAAVGKGLSALGFSGHSYLERDLPYCMSVGGTLEYMAEVRRLREKYAEKIELYLGIEQDYLSENRPEGFDYVIGAVHFVTKGDETLCIDGGAKAQKQTVDTHFGGDYYAMAETYFDTVADVVNKTGADIVAHFDLIAKYNLNGRLFDEVGPRYIDAAIGAMERILKTHRLFEVNTGAMNRLGKPEPYPSAFLLRELCRRGGEVILSSDSHDTESICYKFGEMRELLRTCGFEYVKRFTRDGFADEAL